MTSKEYIVKSGLCSLIIAFSPMFVFAAPSFDKSGVTPNTISLPDGPGSIEGMGESFEPSLNNGMAKHGIPIPVPPGTAGHAPGLALQYDSGSGNGVLGYGWSLGVPYIQRQTDKGIPRYVDGNNGLDDDLDGTVDEYDERDVFIEHEKEELVPTAEGYFFAENQTGFIRYERVGDHWEATRPNGTHLYFGETADGRCSDPANGNVFKWMLEREVDVHSNTIVYAYTRFPGLENTNQVYLSTVSYGPGQQPDWNSYHVVKFEYGSRTDWFEDCRSGYSVRTGMRLTNIVVGTHGTLPLVRDQMDLDGDAQNENVNRMLALDYHPGHRSFLASATVFGMDASSALPPAQFEYGMPVETNSYSASGLIIGGVNEPSVVMDSGLVDLLDVNGDALPDILKTAYAGGAHQVYINQGVSNSSIVWSGAHQMDSSDGLAWNINLDDGGNIAHLSDMDGDGISDLWYKTPAQDVYYFRNSTTNGWENRKLMSIQNYVPPAPFGDDRVKTADIDNDKRIDIIQSLSVGGGAYYRIWYNHGTNGYSRRSTKAHTQGLPLDWPGVDLADINGDRLQDIVRIRPSTVEVLASHGYGQFAAKAILSIPTVTLTDQQAEDAKLRDITGDGLADLVLERAQPGVLWFWVNKGNYTFGDRKIITGMPTGQGTDSAVRWADMNGNGTTDLVYSDAAMSPRIQTVDIGELIGYGIGRNQLSLIDNGIGGLTHIAYETSTRCMLMDWDADEKAAGDRAWPDPLPFPVTVVSQVVGDNSMGNTFTNDYCYHDGFYDGGEKEFRGFAEVEVFNRGDASCPTLVNRYRFDTGRTYEAMKGKVLELSTEQEGGNAFQHDYTEWSNPPRQIMTGENGDPIWFAHGVASSNEVLELGNGAPRWTESEMAYDDYGNETTNANYGIVDGGNRSVWDDERMIVSTYAVNTNAWILNAPASMEIMDENGVVAARTEYYYDDSSVLGEIMRGNLTLSRQWIDPTNPSDFIDSTRSSYDAYGNITAIRDALWTDNESGHWRELVYDSDFHTYPEQERIYTGKSGAGSQLNINASYDAGLGVVLTSTDPNNNSTTYGYDDFGRVTGIVKPGDNQSFPTLEFDYVLNDPITNSVGEINYVETRQREAAGEAGTIDSRVFFDGFGRKVMARAEGEESGQIVVSDTLQFNARQLPWKEYLPYFDNGNLDFVHPPYTNGFVQNQYDALGRVVQAMQPADANDKVVFSSIEYLPFGQELHDEEQTDSSSDHYGCGKRYIYDGLSDGDGNPRLREVHELVKLTNEGISTSTTQEWITAYTYNLLDNWTGYTDSQNNKKFVVYDGLGRQTFMSDPDRGYLWWAYDNVGNVLRRRDAKGQELAYAYDGANRQTAEYYCTPGENLGNAQQPSSHWNVAAGSHPARDPEVAYHYDEAAGALDYGHWWNFPLSRGVVDAILAGGTDLGYDLNSDGKVDASDAVYAEHLQSSVTADNLLGRLAWVEDLAGEQHSSYDARGRATWNMTRLKEVPSADTVLDTEPASLLNFYTGMAYDSADRLTSLTYPDQSLVDYSYNDRGLLETTGTAIIKGLNYNPAGQNAALELGCGVTTSYGFDHRLRLQHLTSVRDALPLQHLTYTYDAASNITGIQDGRSNSQLDLIGTELGISNTEARKFNMTQSFDYDSLYRLTGAQNPSVYGSINYRYDRIGNMLNKSASLIDPDPLMDLGDMFSGGVAGRWDRNGRAPGDAPGPHALTSITKPATPDRTYPYDANGNMLSNEGATYNWDHNDRMVGVEKGSTNAVYTYDFSGSRKTRIVTDEASTNRVVVYYVDKLSEVRGGELIKYVYAGDRRIARSKTSTESAPGFDIAQYYLHDHLCSTHLALSPTGTAVNQQVAHPFGHVRLQHALQIKSIDYGFIGKEQDLETKLHYFGYRYLENYSGRFNNVDPLISAQDYSSYSDGITALDPQRQSVYAYANNRPIVFIDWQGLASLEIQFFLNLSAGEKELVRIGVGGGYDTDKGSFSKATGKILNNKLDITQSGVFDERNITYKKQGSSNDLIKKLNKIGIEKPGLKLKLIYEGSLDLNLKGTVKIGVSGSIGQYGASGTIELSTDVLKKALETNDAYVLFNKAKIELKIDYIVGPNNKTVKAHIGAEIKAKFTTDEVGETIDMLNKYIKENEKPRKKQWRGNSES